MSWVNGESLNVAVASHLGNADAISQMSAAFMKAVNAMEAHGIAHGDLQHGNVLVGAHELILGDGM